MQKRRLLFVQREQRGQGKRSDAERRCRVLIVAMAVSRFLGLFENPLVLIASVRKDSEKILRALS